MTSNRTAIPSRTTHRPQQNSGAGPGLRSLSAESPRTTTVAVASAEPVTLSGLVAVFGTRDDFDVVHAHSEITPALDALSVHRPDVFAVESCFKGVCVLEAIRHASQEVPVLVISKHRSPLVLRRALQCGARGFVSRASSADALLDALGSVASDSTYMEPGLVAELAERSVLPGLTERELGVLYLVAVGYTSAEIAGTLHISPRTVEACRASIRGKLGLKSRAQIHSFANEQGMLSGCDCVPVSNVPRAHAAGSRLGRNPCLCGEFTAL